MCGVAVCSPPDPSLVARALASMRDRGPDDVGLASSPIAAVGVARLAITDPPRGRQPLRAEEGDGLVGFNGAIYNARALVDELGIDPPTGNDGEVIWPLYRRFGLGFADHLEGMFAICIVDPGEDRVVVAVDQLGIKPLYLAAGPDRWFAASVLQAFPAELRGSALRVPAGTVVSSCGEVRAIEPQTCAEGSLDDLLEASVAEQIPREVPWGCLLSGGLDSSTATALAARMHAAVPTFTSGVRGSSDLEAAARVADFLGTDHHPVLISEDELPALLDEAVRVTASPDPITVIAGIGTYVAARDAARHGMKVLLSGEGADELFAGYSDYLMTPPSLRAACLVADQLDLGATECLRLDRCTMAHGVEARVPFLSASLVAKARSLPIAESLDTSGPEPVHKVALRRFARSLLPREIAERPKVGFPDGSGLVAALTGLAARTFRTPGIARLRAAPGAAGYFAAQRKLGVAEEVAALTLARWSELYGDLGTWDEMIARGLVRRTMSAGEYLPFGRPRPAVPTI